MSKTNTSLRTALFLGAATAAALSLSTAAFAQNVETVVVTGTLIQGNANLVSPITVLDSATLDKSGLSTIEGALQNSIINNGPAVTNSWTANGNFAQGASGASLRGLSTNSTLVLFDGMRAAYYPLADDGVRNFVDLNTIPDDIVERVEILRDGASSSYGADAIAGVVNVITKKEFQGLSARAEGGISDRSDAAAERFSVTAGVGDLGKDHVNIYVSANYYHSDKLNAADRPYPFNTYDWTGVCYEGTCGANGVRNGIAANGTFAGVSTGANFLVKPYVLNASGQPTVAIAGGKWQSETTGCPGGGTSVALTVAQQGATSPASVCQYDVRKLWGVINPMITRFGLSTHGAFVLPSAVEGWIEFNFLQDEVSYPHNPGTFYGNMPTGIFYPRFSTSVNYGGSAPPAPGSAQLFLPAYVCPQRVNCTAANGVLNPNNPFAATIDPISGQHESARLIGTDVTHRMKDETRDRSYRMAGGLSGSVFDDWKWNIGVTAMHTDLLRKADNYVYMQHLLDVIADGTYNFRDASQNNTPLAQLGGQTANQYLYPEDVGNATSDEAQFQATLQAPLAKLPGGDLTVAIGTSFAYEAVDAPSFNSDVNGPTQRWSVQNAFGTRGSRDVYSAFFEISAPVIEEIVLNASGRYDSYSSGQKIFTPKLGIWAKPFETLTLKGTYSEGFRIPSFAEANALPTTGYVTNTSILFNNTFLAPYGCTVATFSACPVYIKSGSYGLTTTANPNLDPEHSRSWVMDVTWQPFEELTLTTTYYNIKKSNAIAQLNCGAALTAYYSNAAIPAGCTIVPDALDPSFTAAGTRPRVAFLEAPFVNADAVRTSGFDFGVTYDSDLQPVEEYLGVADSLGAVHVTSSAQATFIQNLDTKFADGHIERYDGTLGNNNLTAGTGTQKWRGMWQTTFTGGIYEFTSTLNWISGYNLSAMDQGTGYRDCGLTDGAVPCRINDYFTWDVNAQAHVTDNVAVYLTVNNVLDNMPPVDTVATYALTGYNVVVAGDGILGRYLKFGVKLDY